MAIPRHASEEKAHVLIKSVELLAKRMPGPEKVTANFPVDTEHECRLRFPVGVIARQIIGKQLAIFKNRADRLSEKTGFAAQFTHRGPVGRSEFSNFEVSGFAHRSTIARPW